MRSIFKKAGIVFIVAGLFVTARAAAEDSPERVSIERFMEEVCGNDLQFQTILIDQMKLSYTKTLNLPPSDLVFDVSSQYSVVTSPGDDKDEEGSVSLSRLFPYTGTELSAVYDSAFAENTGRTTSGAGFKISQDIAENAFGYDTRLFDKILGVEIDVARYQIVEAYEEYLYSLMDMYLDWYRAMKNVETAQRSYEENRKLLDNVRERQKNSIALPVDVNKIEVQVIAKEETLVSLKDEYESITNRIRTAMRYWEETEIIPEDPDIYDNFELDFKTDYEKFRTESRTSSILRLLEESTSLRVERDAHKLLPSISLFAGYSWDGSGHDISEPVRFGYAGVSIDWPFPDQVQRAELEVSRIEDRKRSLTNKNIYDDLYTTMQNIYKSIQYEKKLVALSDRRIELSSDVVEADTENYSFGKISLKDLIDEINTLDSSKFVKIDHMIRLRKLLLEWLSVTDRLVTENNPKNLKGYEKITAR